MSAGLCNSVGAAVAEMDLVDDARRRRDEVEIELALETLLDDLEVQEPEEAAAEAEAEGGARLHLVGEAGVVEAELAHGGTQILELGGVDREKAAEHHRLHRLEAGQGGRRRPPVFGDGVADARVGDLLDGGVEEADLAGAELADFRHLGAEDADAVDVVGGARAHHLDGHAPLEHAVDDAHEHDDAEIGVVPAVDEEGLERRLLVALRRRQALHDRLQHIADAEAGLGGDRDGVLGRDADHLLDLLLDALGLRGRQVDLVEDRHDLVAGVDGVIDVGEGLRLDALRGVDDEQRALAGGEGARHLVGEIDMAGRVHEIEHVGAPVLRRVFEAHGLRLDGDAALALDIHGIEHLLGHLALRQPPGRLDQPVGQRRFAVVDMRHDGEVADIIDGVSGHGVPGGARDARRGSISWAGR